MKILVADDNPEVRSALRLRLEQEPTLAGMGILEVSDPKGLIEYLKNDCPGIVLLDWELPGEQRVDFLMTLRSYCPDMSVIALSSKFEARQEALEAGVEAFISKSDPPENIIFTLSSLLSQMENQHQSSD